VSPSVKHTQQRLSHVKAFHVAVRMSRGRPFLEDLSKF
jgi:hypothetical protein